MKKRNLVIGLGIVVVVVVVVSFLTSGSGPSPDATVHGLFADTSARNYSGICSKLTPSVQSECTTKIPVLFATIPQHISFNVTTTAVTEGSRALVFIVGRVCSGSSCSFVGNPYDATQGMSAGFNTAYSNARSSMSLGTYNLSDPVVPCLRVNGRWYVDVPSNVL
ncbi:MAG: hypothetical protein ACYDEP_11415 [Acidimicrobiales bacterium]